MAMAAGLRSLVIRTRIFPRLCCAVMDTLTPLPGATIVKRCSIHAPKKRAHWGQGMKRLLFTALAVGLALVMLQGSCHAITNSWDYTKYRIQVYMGKSDVDIPDENLISGTFENWLQNDAKYERIAEGTLDDDIFPPSKVRPVAQAVSKPWQGQLKSGDVIIVGGFGLGHEGVVQPDDRTIAHYTQIPPIGQTIKRSLLIQRCPDPHAPHQYPYQLKCGDWEKDPNDPNDTTKDRPMCCGEFKNDTWQQFLSRMGKWKGQNCWIYREKDTDKDTVPDWADKCPATPATEVKSVDTNRASEWCGCGLSQRDKDKDGIKDNLDKCPDTDAAWVKLVDTNFGSKYYGCAPCEIDEDNDGVKGSGPKNCPDQCPGTRAGEVVDEHGCSVRQLVKLRIDADDRVEAGAVIRFTAVLDRISEAELPSGGRSYEWKVNGETLKETGPTISGTVPKNYDKADNDRSSEARDHNAKASDT